MKNSNKVLILLGVSFLLFLLSFIVPIPTDLEIDENFLPRFTTLSSIDKLEEVEIKSGTALRIIEGEKSQIFVEGFIESNCFLYDQSLLYANFYCDVARYTVSYIKNDCSLKLIKSQNSKVYVDNPDISTLHLKLTNSQAIIKQNKNLRKLEISGDEKSKLTLQGCTIDTLIWQNKIPFTMDKSTVIHHLIETKEQ